MLAGVLVMPLLGCQDKPRSTEFYRDNLAEVQKDEQKCKQMRADGKEPDEVLAKNCRLAHDVLLRKANANTAAAIKGS